MKAFLVIAAVLACASAKPKFDNGQGSGSWSGNGQEWGSWSGNGQEWGSWSGNGQDWGSWMGSGMQWPNRGFSLSNLCQLLQLINNGVQWPACQASSGAATVSVTETRLLTAASISQLCQQLQAINNNVNWPACQIAAALG